MNISYMTKEDFKNVPSANEYGFKWKDEKFNSIVIIPTDEMHESGCMCMDFVAVDSNFEPICKLSGISDVLHIDGIGGYGYKSILGAMRTSDGKAVIAPKGWFIDCLPCGYLRLASDGEMFLTSPFALSSFEIYSEVEKK